MDASTGAFLLSARTNNATKGYMMGKKVSWYKREVEHFAESLLSDYVKQIRSDKKLPQSKQINDTIWQTIVLQPFEVLILDSPLLQRLREIRQLGVVHWVYPSAGHSRLEHSIGAVHQVQSIIDELNHPEGEKYVPTDVVHLLRLAALCHDIGHGLMSHVVENALAANGATADLEDELRDEFQKERCQLSEAAAYFLLGSAKFRELLDVAREKTNHSLPLHYQNLLQQAVLGKTFLYKRPLLQELISGPFDADKLDYMARDARMAGVPAVVDIPRLLRKVVAVVLPRHKLPKELAKLTTQDHDVCHVHALALSGARSLDELMLGRILLFDKVYRHQKVRAIEAMVANLITALVSLPPARDQAAMLPLLLADYDILHPNQEQLSKRLASEIPDALFQTISGLGRRLSERRLFVRAYCFSHLMPNDPLREEISQREGLARMRRLQERPDDRRNLHTDICAEVLWMRRLLSGQIAPHINDHEIPSLIALDPPSPKNLTREITRAYLLTGNNKLIRFNEDSAESHAWSNAYLMTRDTGYVFAAEEGSGQL